MEEKAAVAFYNDQRSRGNAAAVHKQGLGFRCVLEGCVHHRYGKMQVSCAHRIFIRRLPTQSGMIDLLTQLS